MGIKADIQEALTEAMADTDGLADVVETITFVNESKGNYDKDSGQYVYTQNQNIHCNAIFTQVEAREVDDNNVKSDDEWCFINGADLTGIEPATSMRIKRVATDTYYWIVDPGKIGGSAGIGFNMLVSRDESRVRG